MAQTNPGRRGWQIDESVRAEAMAAFDLASLRDTVALRRITDFAATLCDAPIALVSLVEDQRQLFLARTGLDVAETPRESSFCQHAMLRDDIMVVPDACQDERFAANPLVTGDPHIRFYAGAPLVVDQTVPLGALCIIARAPRPEGLTALQRQGLRVLADDVMNRFATSRLRL